MNNKKKVYTCESCNALFLCLKFFKEHRQKHAIQEGRTIYPCTHCQTEHDSEHEHHLHSISHKDEPPHSCELCQEKLEGISEEEICGSRRSIGTATDNYLFHIQLDKSMLNNSTITPATTATTTTTSTSNNNFHNNLSSNTTNFNNVSNSNDSGVVSGVKDNEDDDPTDEPDADDDDEDDEDDDDDDEEEDGDEDDEEDEEIEAVSKMNNSITTNDDMCKPTVTNIFYVTNQTITTTSQKNYTKPPRPSRSTGKGKGNRKARITNDGDMRRKFSCSHCGKSFKTKSHLQRHILTHTGEKPYHCTQCPCRFNQSSSLRNHMIAIHTKDYPHFCNKCHKGFLMPAVLQKHLQSSECGRAVNQYVEV